MARWAVFDIDGTLLPGDSMEKRFLAQLRKERNIPYRNLLFHFLKGTFSMLYRNRVDAFKSSKMYLKGIDAESSGEYAKNFFKQNIVNALSAEGLKTIEDYRMKDYNIMLMSGSLDILVKHMEEVCNPDHMVCSVLEIRNGRFTGRIAGLHPYGLRKKVILLGLHDQLEIDFGESVVFANHHSDVHHMKLFGETVVVNPTPELEKIAQKQDWKILEWE